MLNTQFHKNQIDQRSTNKSLIAPFLKIGAAGMLSLVVILGGAQIGDTVAYYSEVETSVGNRMAAGGVALFFSAGIAGNEPPQFGRFASFSQSTALQFEVVIESESTIPMAYVVRGELADGAPTGCEEISVQAGIADYVLDGSLSDMETIATSTVGLWEFTLTLPGIDVLAHDSVCAGDIVFEAKVMGAAEGSENAYTDIKRYPFVLQQISASQDLPPRDENTQTTPSVETQVVGGTIDDIVQKEETLEVNDITMTDETNMDAQPIKAEEETTPVEPTPPTPPAATE